jgi:hypothetical protein
LAAAAAGAGLASSFLPQPTKTAADTAVKAAACNQRRFNKLVMRKPFIEVNKKQR